MLHVAMGLDKERGKFLRYFPLFDGWLTIDGLRYTNFLECRLALRAVTSPKAIGTFLLLSCATSVTLLSVELLLLLLLLSAFALVA